ncbi:MAG: hypothetical protein JO072_14915 [Parafilimonas sp.]|nr:hypothetical protein [Parafilimonas sp.]
MQRRNFIKNTAAASIAVHPFIKKIRQNFSSLSFNNKLNGPPKPVFVYNDWSSYDELSDNIPLTEELAMKELNEVVRLKKNGVLIDYYLMDAFWFDKDGGYRTWHKQHWPNGADNWLRSCKQNNILPGMWFSTNLISGGGNIFLNMIPEWQTSAATDAGLLCLFEGNYLSHLQGSLQLWYDKGVRLFKFDFAYFEAATPHAKATFSKNEIVEKNKVAFMQMLQSFRARNKDVLIVGYNGFGGVLENTFTQFTKTVDPRWLDVFDTLYSGDPRFSDVPMMNIWRSEDTYHDHQNRQFQFNGLPMRRIDSCAFMNGVTGTCYSRKMNCWKGELILDLARGGWMNVYHGNMELVTNDDAKWFAKAQQLFHHFQKLNTITSFGGLPGKAELYGFKAEDKNGVVCTVVNPSQQTATLTMPVENTNQSKLLYADGGFTPVIKNHTITLGAEQLAVVGFNFYADDKYDLGRDETIHIPQSIMKISVQFSPTKDNRIECTMNNLSADNLRIIVQQYSSDGNPYRTWAGAPPNGTKMDQVIKITVTQNNNEIVTKKEYDKMIWSGLSWGVVEVEPSSVDKSKPLFIECSTTEKLPMTLKADVYAVKY